MDLPVEVRRGIADAGFTDCTPIQASTLPLALAGRDVAGQAQTGTGKTAAFLIATFTRLLRNPIAPRPGICCPRALMIAPTRELVIQIREEAELLGKHCGFVMHAVYGGVDYAKQLDRLKLGVDVLVGTPGRLIDYFKQRAYRLDETEILVIDEADRMFDMGFIDDIRYLVRKMPLQDRRQSFLYSATLSQRVLELAYEHMNRVERIAVSEDQVTAENVEQMVYHVGQHEKLAALLGLLAREQPLRGLIFVNTRSMASRLGEYLEAEGYQRGCACRRHRSEEAASAPGRVQERRDPPLGGHRRRVARAPYRRGNARIQLRSTAGPRRLRPPNRPYGACWRVGEGIFAGLRAVRVLARSHRAVHRTQSSLRIPRRDLAREAARRHAPLARS